MKFIDQVRIHAKAGDGGKGCCSFRREKFVPKGGPDGGDGGNGGDVILEADPNTDSLTDLYFSPRLRAKPGTHGQGKQKHGRNGASTICKVPVGTLVYALDQSPPLTETHDAFPESSADGEHQPPGRRQDFRGLDPMADLVEAGQRFVLCAGGQGGKGNTHFKSSVNRAPRRITEGYPGEEGWFGLELRTIADAGLVGFPNAGKSTLLRAISSAHPKVGNYPFTTLVPAVGVVKLDDFRRVTVADIPGLIEGAHADKGLGHEFLRHVVRCKALLFVLDMAGSEGRQPKNDYGILRREIALYDPSLSARPSLVIANKMDLPAASDHLVAFRKRWPDTDVVGISASRSEGLGDLMHFLDSLAPPAH